VEALMGRANPALTIWIYPPWSHHREIEELRSVGHNIVPLDGPHQINILPLPDLILHPAAHAWHDGLFGGPYLKTALSAARKRSRERTNA
jgi:hypothetical protein